MDANVKQLWVEALRSGEYTQGRGVLKQSVGAEYRYCCLGVLCEIAVREGVIEPASPHYQDDSEYWYEDSVCALPVTVKEWAGLDSSSGSLGKVIGTPKGKAGHLIHANDGLKLSFAEIAEIIEEQF